MTAYLSYSGGLDSTALLALLSSTSKDVVAVSFEYGQRHGRKEGEASEDLTRFYEVQHRYVRLPDLSSPALTKGAPVPHGHYAWETMKQTVVQGRNLLFLSTLVSLTQPGDTVAIGVHAGDHAVYPDCRPAFINGMRAILYDAYDVKLYAPFLDQTKADIASLATTLGVPVARTWSCYEGGEIHCGRCGTCVERIEAFMLADVDDPTEYADPDFAATVL